jgi:hypothetical protein
MTRALKAPTMAPRHSRLFGTALLAALVVALPVRSQPALPPPEKIEVAPEPTEQPEPGIKVLDKGPVHEAFAQPGADVRGKGITAPKAPPAPIPELPPDTKPDGDNVKWVPGYWMWDADRNDFIWISGFYRNAPAGREWSPGEWTKAKDGTYSYAPGFWRPTNMNSWRVDLPEPPKTVENGPNTPPDNADGVWIPGVWEFRNGEYVWRPGYWAYPNGELLWQPPQYLATGSGYCYVPGYWDFPFEDRGLLYAPVYFTQPLWQTRGWCHRPRFALGLGLGFGGWGRGGLFNSLYIGPGYNNYYYGNYGSPFGYGGTWLGIGNSLWSPVFGFGSPLFGLGGYGGYGGYLPWYATGRGYCNPNWRHYCWLNRGNANYVKNVQNTYVSQSLGVNPTNAATARVATRQGLGGAINTGVRTAATNATRSPAPKAAPLVQPATQVAKNINAAKVARTVTNPAAVAGTTGGGGNPGGGIRSNPNLAGGGGGVTIKPGAGLPAQGNPIHAGAGPKGNTGVLPKGNAGVLPKGNAAVLPKGNASGVVTNPNGVRVQPGAGVTNPQFPTGRLDRDLPRIDGGAKIDRPPVTIQNPKGGGNPGVTVVPKGNVTIPNNPPVIRSQPNTPAPPPVIRSQPNPSPPVIRSQPSAPVIRPSAPSAPVIRPSMPAGGGVPRVIGGGGGGGGAPRIGGGGGGARPPIGGGGGGRPAGGGGGKGGKR